MARILEGQLVASDIRFGLVVSRFNDFITSHLLDGAKDTIIRHGGDEKNITIAHVPGSFEIPLICKKLAQSGEYDVVIALGAVIRGSTPHFDLVANAVSRGVAEVAMQTSIPVIFGVITTDTIEQAIERSGTKAGNKGSEAALCGIEMANLVRKLSGDARRSKVAVV